MFMSVKGVEADARLPDGPRGLPVVGILPEYSRDPLSYLPRCAREYGGVALLRFPANRAYLLTDPDLVEEVFVKSGRPYVKARVARRLLAFLGNGLLVAEGELARRQRRLIQPAFHNRRIAGYAETMISHTEQAVANWEPGVARDFHADMMKLTLRIVAKTLFDVDVQKASGGEDKDPGNDLGATIGWALGEIMAYSSDEGLRPLVRMLPGWLPAPSNLRYRRARAALDQAIQQIIDERRRRGVEGDDLLGMLMAARDEDGEGMEDGQLKDEALTIVLAGHETTALALSWTAWLLGQNPDLQRRLATEVEDLLGPIGGESAATVRPEDLRELPYLDAVIKEGLRLYPPAWATGREAGVDLELGSYAVPAGTQLFLSPWVVQRDPRNFRDPECFRPERWLDGSTDGLHRYAYFPFGGGARMCLGSNFAKMEAGLLLATIVRHYRLECVEGREPVPVPSISLRPADGVWLRPVS